MFGPTWARRIWTAAVAGTITFFVCSLVPMWTAYPTSAFCITGSNGSLWQMLLAMTEPEMVIEWQFGAFVTAAAVHIVAIAGALMSSGQGKRKPTGQASGEPNE